MFENGTMRLLKLFQEWGGGEIKENDEGVNSKL
jgi:hypothetical protein